MIGNLGKIQAIILDKKKNNHTREMIKTDNKAVNIKLSVKLPSIHIKAEVKFNLNILIWTVTFIQILKGTFIQLLIILDYSGCFPMQCL